MAKMVPNGTAWRRLGKRIKQARAVACLTQRELSMRARVDEASLSRLENHVRPEIAAETLFRLSVALDVRPEWLWRGEEPMRRTSPVAKELSAAIAKAERHPSVIEVAKSLAAQGERHTVREWIARLDEIQEALGPLLPHGRR